MRQSNVYIIVFSVILTIVIGGLLSTTSEVLRPAQQRQIEMDTKRQILSAVMNIDSIIAGGRKSDVLGIYDQRIESLVVNIHGEEVTEDEDGNPIEAETVNIAKNYNRDPEDRLYPVFKFMNEENPEEVEAYIFPMYGNGLWDKIWGFVALGNDLETIEGASFDHVQETPGLGARIANAEIQSRYRNKKVYNEQGELVSVTMVKREHGGGQQSIDYFEDDPHTVDGMSGATLTAKGLNMMMENYLNYYQNYINRVKEDKISS